MATGRPLTLPFGGLAVESARVGDQPARFGRRENGTLFLLLKEKGRAELELEMSAPVSKQRGRLGHHTQVAPRAGIRNNNSSDWHESKQLQVGDSRCWLPIASADGQQVFRVAVDQYRRCTVADIRSLHGRQTISLGLSFTVARSEESSRLDFAGRFTSI